MRYQDKNEKLIKEGDSFPIPKTKFFIPAQRPNRVDRPRLMAKLEEGLRLKQNLTLVSARAGAGKTSLVSEWLRQQRQPSAWLSLDASDNDPRRFFNGLLEALRLQEIQVSHRIWSELEAPRLAPPELQMAELINDLAAGPQSFILVLDDYQLIQNEWIHRAIDFLLERQPPTLHLILITRSDPQLPLHLLRGRGQLVEIRDQDLQFSAAEADQFLNDVIALGLPAEDVAMIEQRTEGWIAGLQMAAISMQGRKQDGDLRAFIASFNGTHRFILDYLVEEVLNQQTPEIQDYLLETSILDRMCADLCDAVLSTRTKATATSQVILEQLERSNLFVVSLDDDRRWYRYHHLFADLLRSILKQRRSEEQIRELHRRASVWFQAGGALDEAMLHTMAAQDFERAAAIIDENIETMFTSSNPELILGWIKALPAEILRQRPWMDVIYANTLAFLGQLDEVDPLLKDVEQRLTPGDPREAETLGHIASVRTYAANLRGKGDEALQMATLSKRYPLERRPAMRAITIYTLADTYFIRDDMQNAAQELSALLRIGERTNHVLIAVTALCTLANIKKVQGLLRQAEEYYARAYQFMVEKNGLHLRVRCAYEFGLADLLRERNQLDAALDLALTATERLRRLGGYLLDCDLTLMRIYQARDETEKAFKALDNAEKDVQTFRFQMSTMLEFRTARVEQWLAAGEVEAASRWAAECNGGSEKEQIVLARLRLAQGRAADAQRLLDTQRPLAEAGERFGRLIEILALQAIALEAQGLHAEADTTLSRAFSLAQPAGYQRLFLDLGQPLLAIQERLSLPGLPSPAAQNGRAEKVPPKQLSSAQNEALTRRELEVLRLLAEGLPNKEMAVRLVVAPSTVKQHLKSICRKLNVHNRTQAVARGRELMLL